MATAHVDWTVDNVTGTIGFRLKYRLASTSKWTEANISGTTSTVHMTNNLLYDFQVVNLNAGLNNPASPIVQTIGIDNPNPTISPINTSVSYSFNNLSADIDTYTATIAPANTPGEILSTHILTPVPLVTDVFTGLSPVTNYLLTITPAANEFYRTYTYVFVTSAVASCANPHSITAILS